MEPAFWDSSALVPLCVIQNGTAAARSMSRDYSMVVWWAAPVEICGAAARLLRMGLLNPNQYVGAQDRLAELRSSWREIAPNAALREKAEHLLDRFPLKAEDALQLAAALAWASGHARARPFVCGDAQLLEAARLLGFQALHV